jgi:hypothetical protein
MMWHETKRSVKTSPVVRGRGATKPVQLVEETVNLQREGRIAQIA